MILLTASVMMHMVSILDVVIRTVRFTERTVSIKGAPLSVATQSHHMGLEGSSASSNASLGVDANRVAIRPR